VSRFFFAFCARSRRHKLTFFCISDNADDARRQQTQDEAWEYEQAQAENEYKLCSGFVEAERELKLCEFSTEQIEHLIKRARDALLRQLEKNRYNHITKDVLYAVDKLELALSMRPQM
jgi:hypothetical protein